MKNISENSRGSFEKNWQDAFDGKELSPSPELWQNLDRHLANQESKKYRKGIFVYKWIAAAAVVMAISVTAVYFYNTYTNSYPQVTKTQPLNNSTDQQSTGQTGSNKASGVVPESALTDNSIDKQDVLNLNTQKEIKTDVDPKIGEAKKASKNAIVSNGDKDNDPDKQGSGSGLGRDAQQGHYASVTPLDNKEVDPPLKSNPLFTGNDKELNFDEVNMLAAKGAQFPYLEPDVADIAMQKVINYDDDPFRKKKDDSFEESLWAGINLSSGYFDPNFGAERGRVTADANSMPLGFFNADGDVSQANVAQSNSGGQSFTFGFNMGKRIAKKWVLQSGINYMNYSADGSTNAFYESSDQIRTPATSAGNLESASSLNLASSLINFDNQFEFLSIPVKAGYVLLDKKISILLSAGVGTDFFLKNSISPDGNGLQEFDIKPGESSPYRSVYFNGLMGTQLRYRFSKHYSFTFEPSYSVAINSFSKSDNDLESFPNVFRIGVGLKYHFK